MWHCSKRCRSSDGHGAKRRKIAARMVPWVGWSIGNDMGPMGFYRDTIGYLFTTQFLSWWISLQDFQSFGPGRFDVGVPTETTLLATEEWCTWVHLRRMQLVSSRMLPAGLGKGYWWSPIHHELGTVQDLLSWLRSNKKDHMQLQLNHPTPETSKSTVPCDFEPLILPVAELFAKIWSCLCSSVPWSAF